MESVWRSVEETQQSYFRCEAICFVWSCRWELHPSLALSAHFCMCIVLSQSCSTKCVIVALIYRNMNSFLECVLCETLLLMMFTGILLSFIPSDFFPYSYCSFTCLYDAQQTFIVLHQYQCVPFVVLLPGVLCVVIWIPVLSSDSPQQGSNAIVTQCYGDWLKTCKLFDVPYFCIFFVVFGHWVQLSLSTIIFFFFFFF